jgi:hypothetical protein
LLRYLLPRTRLQDNVRLGFEVPSEDELALCIITFQSAMMSSVFPRRAAHYDRYVTLREVPDSEVKKWQDALLWFARKLTVKSPRPLVLKSPLHTGRIKLLLQVFPEAKFLHIHRDPYAVFQSARHTLIQIRRLFGLQRSTIDLDDQTIRYYQVAVQSFLEEKSLIPSDRFHEVRYENLERDAIGQLRQLYDRLGFPDFTQVEPAMTRYLSALDGYKKNAFPPLSPEIRSRIAHEWQIAFDAWGYPR